MNFKEIHIGQMIKTRVTESGIEKSRICNFMKCTDEELLKMYEAKSLDTDILLKWSKLLDYDFFRIYSQHLIFYSPTASAPKQNKKNKSSLLPSFRKNMYTKEIIDFILEQIDTKQKTIKQTIEEYQIPKTTLYKWISKYKTKPNED